MKKTRLLILSLTLCLAASGAMASAWTECEVAARVVDKTGPKVVIDILSVTDRNTGFGACPVKTGRWPSAIALKADKKNQADIDHLTAGQVVRLSYQEGSFNGPAGAGGYEDWRYLGRQK